MITGMPDVLDFQIVNALQLYPRISWVQLSRVINVDASTLSRRWQALIQNRLVWTNCEEADEANAREQTVSALVEIRCTPGMRGDVIAALGRQGPIFSIHCTSGARDLYIMVSMPSLALMDRYIDEHVVVVPGIAGTQTHYFRAIYQEASSWRFRRADRGAGHRGRTAPAADGRCGEETGLPGTGCVPRHRCSPFGGRCAAGGRPLHLGGVPRS